MSDIIIKSFLDILNNEKELLKKRYAGSFEFNHFRRFLSYNWIYFCIYFILLFIGILSLISSIKILFFNEIHLLIVDIVVNSSFLFLSFALLVLSINNIIELIKIKKHYVLKDANELENISWNSWDFKDIALKKPIPLEEGKKLQFIIKGIYSIYFILQYPSGSFGWYCITNNKKLRKYNKNEWEENIIDFNKKKIKHFEKCLYNKNISFNHEDIIRKMKKETQIGKEKIGDFHNPLIIVGIRIRTNIFNRKINIKQIELSKE